ncbi:ABC transporter ATP-binding protein [Paucisalibacillus globulus]|uniref:ABC transporter ATP-binding protein n=1 Tax=Paucisalibacillus globulus TaxID=351095 RepID=UPI0004045BDF|nr:ABC transporter ATP-binding protein [Paucisalibacillus globulus]
MEIFKIKDLSFKYPDTEEKALNHLSLTIYAGEFVVICGPSGCGKSTLLRLMKKDLSPFGDTSGDILYVGKSLNDWDEKTLVEDIGFLFQDPDNQIIMEDVLQEIVFGLENIGCSNVEMRKRVAELVHTFGYEQLLDKKVSELSGGQKQILNLLSILLLKPKVLLLDEPTSQLDPIAAKDLLLILERLNTELGITIILVEHRLEELFDLADRVMMMDKGDIACNGTSREVIHAIHQQQDQRFLLYLPAVSLLYLEKSLDTSMEGIPLNVKHCKAWMSSVSSKISSNVMVSEQKAISNERPIIELKDVFYQFNKDLPMVLRDLNIQVNTGDFHAIIGGNGSGKTTLLKVCLGILKPQRGTVRIFGKKYSKKLGLELYKKIAYIPQNPLTFFVQDSIEKEMYHIAQERNIKNPELIITKRLQQLGINHLRKKHPYDCSGGEIQKAALACMLMEEPEILFIDEPTKGLDPISKQQLAKILNQLHLDGITIIMVTHDIEFAAQHATTCAMMFNGNITVEASPEKLFKGNYFYTTTMNRVTQNSDFPEVLTLEEAKALWKKEKLFSSL